MGSRSLSYTEEEAREAVAASHSWAESLRNLGLCGTGGAGRVLKKYVELWSISTDHFDPDIARRKNLPKTQKPLSVVLVEKSTYPRKDVKRRLLADGLKKEACELCGQGNVWRGRAMSLILDHINGIRDDHRLENLQIVCPNCAATLDTHCGRRNRIERAGRRDRSRVRGRAAPGSRKVQRPPYRQLLEEIEASSHRAVGRKYGVSDNAVRKWVRFYECQFERERDDPNEVADPVDPVRDAA